MVYVWKSMLWLKIFHFSGGPVLINFGRDLNFQTILILKLIGGGPVHPIG